MAVLSKVYEVNAVRPQYQTLRLVYGKSEYVFCGQQMFTTTDAVVDVLSGARHYIDDCEVATQVDACSYYAVHLGRHAALCTCQQSTAVDLHV